VEIKTFRMFDRMKLMKSASMEGYVEKSK
jgi:hypothetical protein